MSSASFFWSAVPSSSQDRGERGARAVHEDGGVRAEHHLEGAPRSARAGRRSRRGARAGRGGTTRRRRWPCIDFLNDSGSVTECVAGSKTGGLRSASTKDAAIGPSASLRISASTPRAVLGVHLLERPGAEAVLGVEELEEVELEVPQVGGVVAHGAGLPCSVPVGGDVLLASNKRYYSRVATSKCSRGDTPGGVIRRRAVGCLSGCGARAREHGAAASGDDAAPPSDARRSAAPDQRGARRRRRPG